METMETKVNTTNETESAAHQTGMMDINDFDYISGLTNCKLLAIKNKGISDQVLKILRSENISG